MNVLLLVIPIALALGTLGLFAFLWALRSGQYDDIEGAEYRVLHASAPQYRHSPGLLPRSSAARCCAFVCVAYIQNAPEPIAPVASAIAAVRCQPLRQR